MSEVRVKYFDGSSGHEFAGRVYKLPVLPRIGETVRLNKRTYVVEAVLHVPSNSQYDVEIEVDRL